MTDLSNTTGRTEAVREADSTWDRAVDATDSGQCASQDLEARLEHQIKKWQSKLLDLGNRNPLINCSFNPTRGVVELVVPDTETVWRKLASEGAAGSNSMRFPWRRELVPPPPEFDNAEEDGAEPAGMEATRKKKKEWNPPLDECQSSPKLHDRDLLTGLGDRALERRLRTLDGHAHLSLSEQGVHCLYVAFGFLRWFESVDSDVEHLSPLMLVPMSLSRSSADAPWELTEAEDDAINNLCLRERLKQDFGMSLPPLPDIGDLEEEGARQRFLESVREAVKENDRWEVQDRCALGRFAFPKVAMWQDLKDHVGGILANALCRSVGGDDSIPPQRAFGLSGPLPEAAKLDDEIAPGEIKTILDCDSSQLEAVIAARRGVSFVLDGPPGTGKSQTIANIIADALSEGRKILFVSEKVSALEVVKRRLDDCGLGDFCLECHSSKANRKAVLDELKYCLDLPVEVYDDVAPKLEESKQRRDQLNRYVRSIHRRRPPLGLSPYELYGSVSRAHRLGHAVKSRCELPSVDALDRPRFESWLELLDRAKESADVIKTFHSHSWRGCQMTVRTLTLSDELHHHFGVLAEAFGSIDEALAPLIEKEWLTAEPTPMTLNGVLQSLRDALESPSIPAAWFAAPREIATSILRNCDADDELARLRSRLPQFVDDVECVFPSQQLVGLTLSPEQAVWLERLGGTLPGTARQQHEFIAEPLKHVRALVESLEATAAATTKLVDRLPVPIRPALPPYKLPAVIDLAKLIANVVPMRREWLQADCWPSLRSACHSALTQLDEAARIANRLEGRLSAGQLLELGQAIDEPDQLRAAWNVVHAIAPDGDTDELAAIQQTLQATLQTLLELEACIQDVFQSFGAERTVDPSWKLTDSLTTAIPLTLTMVYLKGHWRDVGVRSKVRSTCSAAISDLQEAVNLRQELEVRLSHRAFKPAAAALADRAPAYRSMWKRLFGGFGAFRQDVAELFKDGCPPTPMLLADLLKLRTWHRRMADVADSAAAAAAELPEAFPHEELSAWSSLHESLNVLDQFASDVPELVSLLPAKTVTLNAPLVMSAASRLGSLTVQLRSTVAGTALQKVLDETQSVAELHQRLSNLDVSITRCHSARSAALSCYTVPPRSIATLVSDSDLAARYATLQEGVKALYRPLVDLLPPAATPTDAAMWLRVQQSIQAAERLGKLVPSLNKYQEVLCHEDRISPAELAESARFLEAAHRNLLIALHDVASQISLGTSPSTIDELIRRPLNDLLAAGHAALPVLESREQILRAVLATLRPGNDVAIEALAAVDTLVERIRACQSKRDDSVKLLAGFHVGSEPDLPEGGRAEARWLQQQTDAGPIPSVVQAVASSPTARIEVTQALEASQRALGGEFPSSLKFLRSVFSFQTETCQGLPIPQFPLRMLSGFLGSLRAETGTLDEWLKFARWRRDMEEQGFGGVVEELLQERYTPEEARSVISARFFRLVFDQFSLEDRLLGEFDLDLHEQSRERFRMLDEWEVRAAAARVRQYQLGRDDRPRAGWFAEATSELGILQREIQKKRRQLPLRKLFAEVPSILQRLKPCIMMSPLSVSTFLQSDELRFDLVIFDEASQVFPWDAIGAIYRGTQLIVAGDEKQLPPTNFFNRADIESDEEDSNDIGDFESILSLCKSIGMPGRGLRWHYRSRREPLIAFSNRHFYSGDLVTFPSIRDASSDAVSLEFVPQGRWIDRANLPEAERVTDLIIHHLRTRPETSLGVIAFNQSQQAAIEDSIYERRRKYSEVELLFHTGLSEPLFVKNLENVQGDERDVIILSMGYGYNEAGKFLKNFGPLTKAGGERRLNVAVTRAREQVLLVASVKAADLDLSGSTSLGAQLLKGYLEYAERGVDALARAIDSLAGEAESEFEREVATALIQRGLHPVLQVGCGGFRIDLALKHPQRPGEFCIGIECDGATYHSSKTARDRDRIRQNILEGLGWNIVRIWSTDWIRNPDRQIDRLLSAYEHASTQHVNPITTESSESEDELEDLKPRIEETSAERGPVFRAIKDVPEGHLRGTFQRIVKRGGAIDLEGLIQQTARELGFARTGKQIRQRLENTLNELLHVGHLRWVGDRIASGTTDVPFSGLLPLS